MTALPVADPDLAAQLLARLYRGKWREPDRCECGRGKIRYRNEVQALAAAESASEDLSVPFTVYKCPGSSAWHKASRGFTAEALRSRARIMAWHLSARGAMHQDALLAELGFRAGDYPEDRGARRRYGQAILTLRVFAALGLVTLDDPRPGYVNVADRDGLRRVMTAGLRDYARGRGISWR